MRRRLYLFMVLLIFIAGNTAFQACAINAGLVVDVPELDFEASPVMIKNEPYIPVKPVLEAMGWKIGWDSKNKTVSAVKQDNILLLKIGKTDAVLNGNSIPVGSPPAILNGISYVSSRFIAQEFGTKVRWNKKDNLIIVSNEK